MLSILRGGARVQGGSRDGVPLRLQASGHLDPAHNGPKTLRESERRPALLRGPTSADLDHALAWPEEHVKSRPANTMSPLLWASLLGAASADWPDPDPAGTWTSTCTCPGDGRRATQRAGDQTGRRSASVWGVDGQVRPSVTRWFLP